MGREGRSSVRAGLTVWSTDSQRCPQVSPDIHTSYYPKRRPSKANMSPLTAVILSVTLVWATAAPVTDDQQAEEELILEEEESLIEEQGAGSQAVVCRPDICADPLGAVRNNCVAYCSESGQLGNQLVGVGLGFPSPSSSGFGFPSASPSPSL